MLCLVKGSPEAVGSLLLQGGHGGKPSWCAPTARPHLPYISPVSPRYLPYTHLPCISPVAPLHLPCSSPASPLHLPCISLPMYEAAYRGLAEEG